MARPTTKLEEDSRRELRLLQPMRDFLAAESAGGILLVLAVVVALIWANSPFSDSYMELWDTELELKLGSHELALSLREWVNDGLMTVFFLVVGLEIKRELVLGELREVKRAIVPVVAAVGGMTVPALIYLSIAGAEAPKGWAIPTATDIALAVGILTLLGDRVPSALRLFLLTLAIVDDIGAIAVIAIFYTDGVELAPLAGAAVAVLIVYALRKRVATLALYGVAGVVIWFLVHESGVHATLTGVALGFLAPVTPHKQPDYVNHEELLDVSDVESAHRTVFLARQSVSDLVWLEHLLLPWSTYLIVPIFALANAGIPLGADQISDAFGSSIALGIFFGLLLGKPIGVFLATWLAVRFGAGRLAEGITWSQIAGVGVLAGIGFTVAIFVTGLAFADIARQDSAKLAILTSSTLAAMIGSGLLLAGLNRRRARVVAKPLEPVGS